MGKQAQPDECIVACKSDLQSNKYSDQCAVACRFGLTSVSYNYELDSQLLLRPWDADEAVTNALP